MIRTLVIKFILDKKSKRLCRALKSKKCVCCTRKDAPERMHQLCKVLFISGLFHCFTYKMTTRQLNIKNRSYYFYNDLINMLNFEVSNLKQDRKPWKDLDIYFICYVDKNPDWNVNSVNPL